MSLQTLTLAGCSYVIVEKAEYDRLARRAGRDGELPALPKPLPGGNYPAVAAARAVLARKLVKRRWAVGLTQRELARQAGIRPEVLNRVEKGKVTPTVKTVEAIDRALKEAERGG